MKQKNFSKVLREENIHSSSWTVSSYGAKFLPKCSWMALLILVAFLFPSKLMAQGPPYAILPANAIVPLEMMSVIGENPLDLKGKVYDGGNYTISADTILKLSTWGMPVAWSGTNGWPDMTVLGGGDVYQATLTIAANTDYVFSHTSDFFKQATFKLPASADVGPLTNWYAWNDNVTLNNAVKWAILVDLPDKIVVRVAYQMPKTITALTINVDAIVDSLVVGRNLRTGAINVQDLGVTQWTITPGNATTSYTRSPANPWRVPGRFDADSTSYTVTPTWAVSAGYTFIGVDRGAIKWTATGGFPTIAPRPLGRDTIAAGTLSNNTAGTPAGIAIQFRAFSQFPKPTIDVATAAHGSDVYGEGGSTDAVDFSHLGWDPASFVWGPAPFGWSPDPTTSPASYGTVDWTGATTGKQYFLPDSIYTITFAVGADGVVPPSALPYGFFGLPANYYGGNDLTIASAGKNVWRGWGAVTSPDTMKVTFQMESNPSPGDVWDMDLGLSWQEALVLGGESPWNVGDTIYNTGNPDFPTAVFWGFYTTANPGDPDFLVNPLAEKGSGATFFSGGWFVGWFEFITDTKTFYMDDLNADFTEKYTIGGEPATFIWNGPTAAKSVMYGATFKMPTTIPGAYPRVIATPQPIAGLTPADRQEISDIETGGFSTLTQYLDTVGGKNPIQVLWFDIDTVLLADNYVFETETPYISKTIMAPADGYTFWGLSDMNIGPILSADPNLPGHPGNMNWANDAWYEGGSNELLTVWNVTPRPVSRDTIFDFDAPVAGAKPIDFADMAASSNVWDEYWLTEIIWTTAGGDTLDVAGGDVFEAGTEYLVTLKLEAVRANWFTMADQIGNPEFFVLKDAAGVVGDFVEGEVVVTVEDNYALFTYKFAATDQLIDISALGAFTATSTKQIHNGFKFPTWVTAGDDAMLIPPPNPGDTIVNNDQYYAVVEQWFLRTTAVPVWTAIANPLPTSPLPINPFLGASTDGNFRVCVNLNIIPKPGYTTYGLIDELGAPVWNDGTYDRGRFFTYTNGGQQDSIVTYIDAANDVIAQIHFKRSLHTVTQITGFTEAVEKNDTVKTVRIGNNQAATVDFVRGELYEGTYLAGEPYKIEITVPNLTGGTPAYTLEGLKPNMINFVGDNLLASTIASGDTIRHAVGSNVFSVAFTTAGRRIKPGYQIKIDIPVGGGTPATTASIVDENGNPLVPPLDCYLNGVTWSPMHSAFQEGVNYGTGILFDDTYSFYGLPETEDCGLKVYGSDGAIVGYKVFGTFNQIAIVWPTSGIGMFFVAPDFAWSEGVSSVSEGKITIENNTSNTYKIDKIVPSDDRFEVVRLYPALAEGDTIKAGSSNEFWVVKLKDAFVGDMIDGSSVTLTMYYYDVNVTPKVPLYVFDSIDLTIYGVGITLPKAAALNAFGENGTLTVQGLVAGEPFSVHNAQGVLIYRGIAKASEAAISAPVKGVYIITSGDKTLKMINK